MALNSEAFYFAAGAHAAVKQVRKYTLEPYINHPVEVANILQEAGYMGDWPMIQAALLHDVVEDTGVSLLTIEKLFGDDVARLVAQVTDISRPEDGNRETRKKIDREHLARASNRAKTIKLADFISNTQSIVKYDPDFAKVYLQEKMLCLEVLKGGDQKLWDRAYKLAADGLMEVHLRGCDI